MFARIMILPAVYTSFNNLVSSVNMLPESPAKVLMKLRLQNIRELIVQQRWSDAQLELAAFMAILQNSTAGDSDGMAFGDDSQIRAGSRC